MSLSRHIPYRRCIGCGSRREKNEMIRLVRSASGSIGIDTKSLQGRGFYLCSDLDCLNTASKKMRKNAFLKSIDLEGLRTWITRKKGKQEDGE